MTGIGHGACGIDVTIPYLLLTHSTVTGGSEGTDNTLGIGPVNGYAAVKNPSGTVAALDSTIIGGDGMDAYLFPQQFPGGGCPSVPGPGMGGPGIAAAEIFQAGSTVKGGMGSEIYEINVLKCHQGSGPAYTTITVVSFPKTLTEFGIPKLGGNWTLQWTSTSSTVALLVTSDPVKPFLYVGVGWFFSNLMETHVAEMAPGGPQPHARVLTIPVNPALVGLELVAQVWDPAVGMGRPIVRAVVP
jgi:hypothetical protein